MALQLVSGEIGRKLDVVLGGGYREFLPRDSKDPIGRVGRRTDNRDLIREWILSSRRPYFAHDRVNISKRLARVQRIIKKYFSSSKT